MNRVIDLDESIDKTPLTINRYMITSKAMNNIKTVLTESGICEDDAWSIVSSIGKALINSDGKFVKRLAKRYKTITNKKLDCQLAGKIGNIVGGIENRLIWYDIVKRFDWDQTDYYTGFGNSSSCWWNTYTNSRDTLDYYNGSCMRFWKNSGEYGFGRLWIAPCNYINAVNHENDEKINDGYIAFNLYGLCENELIEVINQLGYKIIPIEINNTVSYTIPYINRDEGWYISENDTEVSRINITMYEHSGIYDETFEYYCDVCGTGLDDWSLNTVENDDNLYCESCYNKRYFYCEECENTVLRDYEKDVNTSIGKITICEDCANNNYYLCEECQEYFEICTEYEDAYYCDHCKDDMTCETCGNMSNDIFHGLCTDCRFEHKIHKLYLNVYTGECKVISIGCSTIPVNAYLCECGLYWESNSVHSLEHWHTCDPSVPLPVITDNQLSLFNLNQFLPDPASLQLFNLPVIPADILQG